MPIEFPRSTAPLAIAAALVLAACASAPLPPAASPAAPAPVAPMPNALLSSSADLSKVIVAYSGLDAQAEITSPSGIHVYIDVVEPSLLETKPGPDDLLCTTHDHPDHRSVAFERGFPGRWIHMEAGETLRGDVRILCLPSAHNASDAIGPGVSTNYLFLVETGGLRILHTGDIGQLSYSEAQKAAFGGRIDLLFQQFENSYSSMSASEGKGFRLLADLGPRLVIPTHSSTAATRRQVEELPALFDERASVELSSSALPEETTVLFAGYPAKEAWKLYSERSAQS